MGLFDEFPFVYPPSQAPVPHPTRQAPRPQLRSGTEQNAVRPKLYTYMEIYQLRSGTEQPAVRLRKNKTAVPMKAFSGP